MIAYQQPELAPLNYTTATQEADQLVQLMGLVDPDIATSSYLLAVNTPTGAVLHAKWQHSYALRQGEQPIGIMLGYEKAPDGTALYPTNELHLGVLAVDPAHQGKGYGASMLRAFVDSSIGQHYTGLVGPIEHVGLTVADSKLGARRFYQSFGFRSVGGIGRRGQFLHVLRASVEEIVQTERYQRTPTL